MFGYWACMVLATIALLPAGTFRDLQGLLMLVAALLAGALALLSVRRQRTLFLALLMPVLLVLYVFVLNLLQAPARH
jgi:lipopolysaccharide export LptBFGC system permease protein LptF